MKKLYSILLALIISFSLSVGIVSAAQNGTLELVEARNDSSGGVIMIFRLGGDWDNSELKELKQGQVFLGDENFGLHCKVEDDLVACTTTRKVAGNTVRVYLAGFIFYPFIPPASEAGGATSQTCYNVYDIDEVPGGLAWFSFDTHCPDSTPNDGDLLSNFPDPWAGTSTYEFNSDGFDFCQIEPSVGIGYYFLCD